MAKHGVGRSPSSYQQHRFTPSDSHHFGPPGGYTTRALAFPDDDQLEHNMREQFRRPSLGKQLYATRIERGTLHKVCW